MAAKGAIKDAFSFVAGLNTEGGFFVTPENSWVEGVNVVPNSTGLLTRRNGLDFPETNSYINLTSGPQYTNLTLMATTAYSTGNWTSVNGNGNVNFIAYQIGEYIYFTNSSSENVNTNASHVGTVINLTTYATAGSTTAGIRKSVASYASTQGKLIITSQYTSPIMLTYNATTNTITASTITIRIRDFDEFTSPVAVTTEYTQAQWESIGFYQKALYNLYNHGWTDTQINAYKTANGSKLPSNTKQWIFGKDTNDDFSATFLNKQDFGTSQAPKGRFIINAFNKTRTAGGVTYTETTEFRPSVCSFFAGRVWYAGVNNSTDTGKVYFSQVMTTSDKAGYCYQSNDPTSEVISDLQDDDGGVIIIPEASNILKLIPLGRGIAVLATNGVWFISGIDLAFTASSYSVEKITNVGCLSEAAVVSVENALIYWSNAGIYAIQPGNTGAEYSANNISDGTLKSFYNSIPILNKRYVSGAYNSREKLVYWLYSTDAKANDEDNIFSKNAMLVLDLKLNVFYWHSFNTDYNGIPIEIVTTTESIAATEVSDNVLANGNIVYANANKVQTQINNVKSQKQIFKVLCTFNLGSVEGPLVHSFADFENTRNANTKFKDFYSNSSDPQGHFDDAVEATAYVITGYNLAEVGPARSKTGQYLSVFMNKTETAFDNNTQAVNESSCWMQTRWDFTNLSTANKWSDEVQVYRQPRIFLASPNTTFDDGYALVVSKNKLRGRGKAIQMKFRSEEGKDMQLVGWSGTFVGNTNV